MAKGYWIVRVDIRDPEQYKRYIAANAAPFAKFGAKFLARAGSRRSFRAPTSAACPSRPDSS